MELVKHWGNGNASQSKLRRHNQNMGGKTIKAVVEFIANVPF